MSEIDAIPAPDSAAHVGCAASVCSPSELFLNFYAHGPIGVWRDADGAKEAGDSFRAARVAVRFREAPDFSEVEGASPAEMEYAAEVVEKLDLMAGFSPIGDLADVIGEILETALADVQEAISKGKANTEASRDEGGAKS